MSLFLSFHDKLLEEVSKPEWNIRAIERLVRVDPSLLRARIGSHTLIMKLIDTDFDFMDISDFDSLTLAALDALRYPDVYEDDLDKYRFLLNPSSSLLSKLILGGFETELTILVSNTNENNINNQFPHAMKNCGDKIFNLEIFSINSLSNETIKRTRTILDKNGLGDYTYKVFEGYDVNFDELSFESTPVELVSFYNKYGKGNIDIKIPSPDSDSSYANSSDSDCNDDLPDDHDKYSHEYDSSKLCNEYHEDYFCCKKYNQKVVEYMDLAYNHKTVSLRVNYDCVYFLGAIIKYCFIWEGKKPIYEFLIQFINTENINWLIGASLRYKSVRSFLGELLTKKQCVIDRFLIKYVIDLYGDPVKFQLNQFGDNFSRLLCMPTILIRRVSNDFDFMGIDGSLLNDKTAVGILNNYYLGRLSDYHRNIIELFENIMGRLGKCHYIAGYVLSFDILPDNDTIFSDRLKLLGIDNISLLKSKDYDIRYFIAGLKVNMSAKKINKKISEILKK